MIQAVRDILLGFGIIYAITYMNGPKIDDKLAPVFNEVKSITDLYCTKAQYKLPSYARVKFSSLPLDVLGECKIGMVHWQILINKHWWDYMDDETRFQLMAHEVTHCFFEQDHVVTSYSHYMNPVLPKLSKLETQHQFVNILRTQCGEAE